jgi:hypothetical protein
LPLLRVGKGEDIEENGATRLGEEDPRRASLRNAVTMRRL